MTEDSPAAVVLLLYGGTDFAEKIKVFECDEGSAVLKNLGSESCVVSLCSKDLVTVSDGCAA
ncbi:MAG: hypothetical protein K6C36_08970, partial [Clostridia bacterium]|nr:hypothetical protein [Clostridia bacterium]